MIPGVGRVSTVASEPAKLLYTHSNNMSRHPVQYILPRESIKLCVGDHTALHRCRSFVPDMDARWSVLSCVHIQRMTHGFCASAMTALFVGTRRVKCALSSLKSELNSVSRA